MKQHSGLIKTAFFMFIACLCINAVIFSQVVLWKNTAPGNQWFTASNWIPSTTAAGWTPTKTARFLNTGTKTIGINMGLSSPSLQDILIEATALPPNCNITIGNSSTVPGTLTLNGKADGTILSTLNVGSSLTLTNNIIPGGTAAMNVALVRDESRIMVTQGSTIKIASNITGAGKALNIQTPSLGGLLELSGDNSYTGITYLQGGGGGTLARLSLNNPSGNTLPATNKVYLDAKSVLQVKTDQILNEIVMVSGLNNQVVVETGATLTITGRLAVTHPNSVVLNGTGKLVYAPGATLEYSGSGALNTSDTEFPAVNGPTNLVIKGNLMQLILHSPRSIAGSIAPNAPFILGNNNFTAATVANAASPVVTNGTGMLYLTNVGVAPVSFPVSPVAGSMADANTISISNGSGLTYGVRVENGIAPAMVSTSGAVNRTWHITPSTTPMAPVGVSFAYASSQINAGSGTAAPAAVWQFNAAWNAVRTGLVKINPLPVTLYTLAGSADNRFVIQHN